MRSNYFTNNYSNIYGSEFHLGFMLKAQISINISSSYSIGLFLCINLPSEVALRSAPRSYMQTVDDSCIRSFDEDYGEADLNGSGGDDNEDEEEDGGG
ncbi:hypothetical protein QVD17_24425 [Tagetes erecta]|uniref:Uncharacterized protein n=1 Tax=Tagetes erecta TaxID=13708 RepID=A0AAD8KHU9_TARER|nr:hypothetical protein QVD17_24425 [Tagetes erecta]